MKTVILNILYLPWISSFASSKSSEFHQFDANETTMTCSPTDRITAFDKKIRGVNIGGWMVVEPWITPSLFYQFLGGNSTTTAMDMYTFCTVLGSDEGNRQLRNHWERWVTKDIIKKLKVDGKINSLRLPVGDWMYNPYEPYIGCTDGALEYVDRLLDWAHEYDMSVLIDIHGVIGSQNGLDNSGQTLGLKWTSNITFEHWPNRTAEWMGKFDRKKQEYVTINHDHISLTLETITNIVRRYKNHPAILGLQPVNEPWEFTPINHLKRFYWDGYLITKKLAPSWKYVMHDSFRFSTTIWGNFMSGCPDKVLDTHVYQAWKNPTIREDFFSDACKWKNKIEDMEEEFGPVVVAEWSLATDNCAMWLNGFNDNMIGFPLLPCKYIPCGQSYLGPLQPGLHLDPDVSAKGPYGTGASFPSYGQCPVGRDWVKGEGLDQTIFWLNNPQVAPGMDDTDTVMVNLALKKIHAFTQKGHGFYFWNFRTELNEPRWNYMLAVEKGWISTANIHDETIREACSRDTTPPVQIISRQTMMIWVYALGLVLLSFSCFVLGGRTLEKHFRETGALRQEYRYGEFHGKPPSYHSISDAAKGRSFNSLTNLQ